MLHPNRRGQPWRFGMKLHIGVDGRRGLAQRMGVTAARRHDRPPLPELRQAHAQRVSAGSAWAGQQAQIAAKAPRVKDFTNPRIRKAAEVDARERKKNKTQSKLQARLAQAFGVLNRLWGLTQRRKRGWPKTPRARSRRRAWPASSWRESDCGQGCALGMGTQDARRAQFRHWRL